MNRVTIIACAGTGVAMAALAWLSLAAPEILPTISADMLSRSAGLALLGIALIAAGLAFRAAPPATRQPASASIRPRVSEYRCGFGGRFTLAPAQRRQPAQESVVVPLRRAAVEEADAAEAGIVLSSAELERLRNNLNNRAARLCARDADLANRRLMRGRNLQGPTPG